MANNRVYGAFFPGKKPAGSTAQVRNVVGTKVEVEAVAYRP